MRCLVWFRADLRVRDNGALWNACREADDGVVGVFLVAPEQWRAHDWGGNRVDFMMRTLGALGERLAELNIPLIVQNADRFSDAPAALLRVARESGCDRLHFNKEYELNEARRDAAVEAAFAKERLGVAAHDDQVIIAPGEVRTQDGRFFTVFTAFKRRWIERADRTSGMKPDGEDSVAVLGTPRKQKPVGVKATPVPTRVPGFEPGVGAALWPAGEDVGLKRLKSFASGRIGAYKDDRDAPAREGTSRISPYLAVGAVSPRQCLKAAVEANEGRLDTGQAGAVQWIGELVWREFYKHILVGYPRVCMGKAFKAETDGVRWSSDEGAFAAWCAGRTGVPIVDAAMRQLLADGWMHNRMRMVTAMYLTKDLFIDWRWGERHFMRHLVDGDFASNNGGWQWSASTGTDAAPYFRIFNPVSQSRGHDPDGSFIRKHVPELRGLDGETIHDPPPSVRAGLGYPEAIADHARARERVMKEFKRIGGAGTGHWALGTGH